MDEVSEKVISAKQLGKVVDKFTLGYNKGIVMGTINTSSMQIVRKNMQQIVDELSDVVSAIEEIRAASLSSAEKTGTINNSMTTLVNKNSEMGKSLEVTSDSLGTARNNARNLQQQLSGLQKNSLEIQRLSKEIQDVSEITDVLSINASIEAARAGEAGAGFRVVATEVRKLASATKKSANEITGTIGGFLTELKEMAETMGGFMEVIKQFDVSLTELQTVFSENSKTAGNSANQVAQINNALDEQSKALDMGMNSLIQVNNLVKDTNTMTEMLGKSHEALDNLLS